MPRGKPTKYSKELKLSVVYLMLSKKFRPKDIFAMYDLDRQTVYRWVGEFKAKGEEAFEDRSVIDFRELKKLQKENEDLRLENEILKKATAYFAEQQKRK